MDDYKSEECHCPIHCLEEAAWCHLTKPLGPLRGDGKKPPSQELQPRKRITASMTPVHPDSFPQPPATAIVLPEPKLPGGTLLSLSSLAKLPCYFEFK